MNPQPALFADAVIQPLIVPTTDGKSVEEQFDEFMDANPWVLAWFRNKALELVGRGYQRIGINMLREVFRYETMLDTSDQNSNYKINNSYAPFLSRRLAASDPRLANVFEFRRSQADQED